jgi:hypothetical protein
LFFTLLGNLPQRRENASFYVIGKRDQINRERYLRGNDEHAATAERHSGLSVWHRR